ncbi:hypothetical protein AB0K16_25395 [Nonomuraea jabiensis]|uniref:hypothetical protein n=1 Tax=Nonomuraea jabiensis TaxID=882448 RepID=UPI003415EF11
MRGVDSARTKDRLLTRFSGRQWDRRYDCGDTDPEDARRIRLQVTPLGYEVMRQGEAIFDELRDQWAKQIGAEELKTLEAHLSVLVGTLPVRFDTPTLYWPAILPRPSP